MVVKLLLNLLVLKVGCDNVASGDTERRIKELST